MLRVTRHGTREMVIGSVVLIALALLILRFIHTPWSLLIIALVLVPVLIWLFAFFRDPERIIPDHQHVMVSPADGKVSDVEELPHVDLLNGPGVRIGIFLSVFNVHVNRAPCDGKVVNVIYKKGKFINAMNHNKASDENESNTLVLADTQSGEPIAVIKQIVGLIARRIICTSSIGDSVRRGDRIGMIKFGSRTELYIPKRLSPKVEVTVGQTLRGGMDVIATLQAAAHTAPPGTVPRASAASPSA